MSDRSEDNVLRRELGDGLVLRSARPADGSELADFNATMHGSAGVAATEIAEWTRDLVDVPHPTFRPERDITVVEDTATRRIVSALFLIPQVWSYAGISMKVGQPELIATHPDYRRRGLVRAQFDVIHEWSRAAGQLWQFISGIPWYYRQFGYTYALDLRPRPVLWLRPEAPPAPADFSLRAATSSDVEFLAGLEADAPSGTSLGPLRGPDGFTLELARRPGGLLASEIHILVSTSAEPEPVGFVAHQRRLNEGVLSLRAFELRRGINWLAPTAAVVAHLYRRVREHPDGAGRAIRFAIPSGHPAVRCSATQLGWGPPGSYGLYVRVPDVVALVRAVAPVLEARLTSSPAAAWTGELCTDLYQGGLRLQFDEGRWSKGGRRPSPLRIPPSTQG